MDWRGRSNRGRRRVFSRPLYVVPCLLSLLLLSRPCTAQKAASKHFSLEDGLLSDGVTSLCQDSNGFLWIGTDDGLSVYDGSVFKSLTTADGLGSSMVNCLHEDIREKGLIWVGTNGGGIARCSKSGIVSCLIGKNSWSNRVNSITQSDDGTLYCSTDDGIYEFKHGIPSIVAKEYQGHPINRLVCRGDSLVFVDPFRHLVSYDLTHAKVHTLYSSSHGVNDFSFDAENHLWVSTWGGKLIDLSNGTKVPGDFWKEVTFMVDDKLGNMLVGTLHGLYEFNKKRASMGEFLHLTTSNGLPSDELLAGLTDEEGELWIGTRTQGLTELSSLSTFSLPVASLMFAIDNSQAASDQRGHVWLGEERGLMELSFGKLGILKKQRFSFSSLGISSSPVGVRITDGNKIWIAFHDGMIRSFYIDRGGGGSSSLRILQSYSVGSIVPNAEILSFIVDREQRIWCSCANIGVLEFETGMESMNTGAFRRTLRVFDTKSGLPDNSIRAMFEDSRGNLWLGGYIGGLVESLVRFRREACNQSLYNQQRPHR